MSSFQALETLKIVQSSFENKALDYDTLCQIIIELIKNECYLDIHWLFKSLIAEYYWNNLTVDLDNFIYFCFLYQKYDCINTFLPLFPLTKLSLHTILDKSFRQILRNPAIDMEHISIIQAIIHNMKINYMKHYRVVEKYNNKKK